MGEEEGVKGGPVGESGDCKGSGMGVGGLANETSDCVCPLSMLIPVSTVTGPPCI